MPKHHAIRHMITPSNAKTMRLFSFITSSPAMITAMPTSSIHAACHGLTILLFSILVILSLLTEIELKKDNKKAMIPVEIIAGTPVFSARPNGCGETAV